MAGSKKCPAKTRRNSMRETASFHRFCDLPPEIRNKIYSLLLVTEDPIAIDFDIWSGSRPQDSIRAFKYPHGGPLPPREVALLRVNQSMLLETAPILYGYNTFSLNQGSLYTWDILRTFVHCLPQLSLKSIRHLDLDYPYTYNSEYTKLDVGPDIGIGYDLLKHFPRLSNFNLTFTRWMDSSDLEGLQGIYDKCPRDCKVSVGAATRSYDISRKQSPYYEAAAIQMMKEWKWEVRL